jgi:phosphoribosyl-ATP pyrophosphohydrolase
LGLAYSSRESLRAAIDERRGVYYSRSRGGLWRRGETSGNAQELLRIDVDCDRDALRFTVRQAGAGFCHQGMRTCWGEDGGLSRLARRLPSGSDDSRSYTGRLLRDQALLKSKLVEEARELAAARTHEAITHEAADVLYFTLVKLASAGLSLDEVARELDRRALRVTRRAGDAKPQERS